MRRRLLANPALSSPASDAQPEVTGLVTRFDAVRAELKVPEAFGDGVLAEARAAVPSSEGRVDLTDLPFVTLDPAGSTDLDQAMVLSRRGDGFHVDYAIADVPAWLAPSGAVAAEAMRRGQTVYAPDRRTGLHPPVLSEDRASLLPDGDRPALVWRFDLAGDGSVTTFDVVRATVRSRAQLDYASVQAALDGSGPAELAELGGLLREIGSARQALEVARGGASLPLPEQEVLTDDAAPLGFVLRLRPPRPVEDWNAQLSLMTGIAAAELMLKGRVGVLRTLPPADRGALGAVRRLAKRVGVEWPDDEPYGAMLRRLDVGVPQHLALLHAAGSLFRGSAYVPFDGVVPTAPMHAAVAAPYAHVTAPLRRLVDRFGLEAAYCVARGLDVPDWVRAGLPLLPEAMSTSERLAGEVDRRCVDVVEAALLEGRVGESFPAVVVEADKDGDGGRVQLVEPPVVARCTGPLVAGTVVAARLTEADPDTATTRFAV
ncbi:RNB domain-containing ribonuclease [Spongisporangium articulatum]|uniref:RNB domain-containing ribonuclease n=1 Tax=Spongisporangium articulatum TaxID=3362603 RepID=A0ABW8ANW1_9ACTN